MRRYTIAEPAVETDNKVFRDVNRLRLVLSDDAEILRENIQSFSVHLKTEAAEAVQLPRIQSNCFRFTGSELDRNGFGKHRFSRVFIRNAHGDILRKRRIGRIENFQIQLRRLAAQIESLVRCYRRIDRSGGGADFLNLEIVDIERIRNFTVMSCTRNLDMMPAVALALFRGEGKVEILPFTAGEVEHSGIGTPFVVNF